MRIATPRAGPVCVDPMAFVVGHAGTTLSRRQGSCRRRAAVVTVGELLLDCVAGGGECLAGGAPGNVASALVKLGTSAGLLGAVGADADGRTLVQTVADAGVDTALIQMVEGRPTRRVVVAIDAETGERNFVGFEGADNEEFADAFAGFGGALPGDLTALVTGTLGLAFEGSAAALRAAAQEARQMGALVLTDVNWRPVFWSHASDPAATILEFVRSVSTLVKISEEEVEFLMPAVSSQCLERPQEVLEELGGSVQGVLVTGGPDGASYALRKGEGFVMDRVRGFAVDSVDTTGAGDAFVAGFIGEAMRLSAGAAGGLEAGLASLDSEALTGALTFGCAAGALTTTQLGAMAAQPTRLRVQEFLAQQQGRT